MKDGKSKQGSKGKKGNKKSFSPHGEKVVIYHQMIQTVEGAVLWIPSVDCPEVNMPLWIDRCFQCKLFGNMVKTHFLLCASKNAKKPVSKNPREDYVAGAVGGLNFAGQDIADQPPTHDAPMLNLIKKKEGEDDGERNKSEESEPPDDGTKG